MEVKPWLIKLNALKKVREITGKGLYECKTTLEETNYDIERSPHVISS